MFYNKIIVDCSCTRVSTLGDVLVALTVIPPAGEQHPLSQTTGLIIMSLVFAGLRAYALTQRHWVSALIFLLSVVQFVTNMVRNFTCVESLCVPLKRSQVVFRYGRFDISYPLVGCIEYQWIPPVVIQLYVHHRSPSPYIHSLRTSVCQIHFSTFAMVSKS